MGKRNKKSATGGIAPTASSTRDALPSFDENALSALTAKIEKGFGQGKSQKTGKEPAERSAKQGKGGKNGTGTVKKSIDMPRGTKRDANGNAKVTGNAKHKAKKVSEEQPEISEQDSRAILLQEILALGGTEEDLDLIGDAESDEENESSDIKAAPDKSFQKELASFVKGLGIEADVAEIEDEDSVAELEEEEVDEEWEEASQSESDIEGLEDVKTAAESSKNTTKPAVLDDESSNNPNRLIFEARPDWHSADLPALEKPESDNSSHYRDAITNLKAYAVSLLESDSNLYASKHLAASSSHRFLSTIMASGTLSDKVSALTLVVQESPIHTTKSFESLLALAKKRSRGQAVTALGALKDLLGAGVVLPADRRLKTFATQPGLLGTLQRNEITNWQQGHKLPGNISKAHLISWAYEDWLKESYFDMLKVLEGWCGDEIEYARSRAVTYVYELLKEKPEQEANLLRLLVNKLGDPDKKIASRTSYLLLQLKISHPLMKPIIIRSIESELLLRPGQSAHAKYYAINTLNQTILSGKEEEVAKKLLDIYFALFVSLLKKPEIPKVVGPVVNRKGQIQGGGAPMGKKAQAKAQSEAEARLANEELTEKMISAVLTGVNRAFPFSKSDDITLENHMDTLFRITHSSNFNTSIQALMLIEQFATSKHLAVDRFYRTLYESLLDPRLVTSSKHALYLNLLFRALRADLSVKRVKAFTKRMLQVVTLHQPPFICGILYLIRELETIFPGLKSLLTDAEEDEDDGEEVFRDVPEDGGDQQAKHKSDTSRTTYDGKKRDPEHSNADKSCLWELLPFLVHFHPSVSLFASRLLADEKMPPKPDLASHTLSSFLDKFVYRNAKSASAGPKGSSIMQPLSGGDNRGFLLSSKANTHSQSPVNTEAFWRKKAEDVAVDEVFFHKYFSQIGKTKQASDKKKKTKTDDASDNEDEDEDEIWQALVASKPEVEGPGDEDSDMEMLDLDDSDAESDEVDVEVDSDDDGEGGVDLEDSDAMEEDFSGVEEGDEEGSDIDELFARELEVAQPKEDEEKGEETSKQRKRKLKSLPTFASAEDYADMLDNDDDEDAGL